MMPELDGYGVLFALNKNDLIRNTPFIFITAKCERSELRKGMELGADDYITKPFSPTELLSSIKNRFNKQKMLNNKPGNAPETLRPDGKGIGEKELLNIFVSEKQVNHYKKRQVIYTEGNQANRLYYILKGKVKEYKKNEEGKELVTGLCCAGDFLGYKDLFEKATYRSSAETIEETELAVIPKEAFEQLLCEDTATANNFIRMLAKNVSETESQLVALAYNSLRKKVAAALLYFRRKYQQGKEEYFEISISRGNLATIAGTAKESLIRTLTDFKSEKLIDIVDGNIIIINEKKLQYLVN
jgi:CRP-like cAMP-binding protein